MPDSRYIHAGRLIDGSGGPVRKNVLLTIVDGLIAAIKGFATSAAPPSDQITDLSHGTILPPLIDCHMHLALSATDDQRARAEQLEAGYAGAHDCITRNLHSHFIHGVLAVRDAGDRHGHVLRFRNEHAGTDREPVIVKASGNAWHKQGRYGSMLGKHPGENESLAETVARETAPGDFIKIIHSGPNSLNEFGKETLPQFDRNELYEMVRMAEQQGKKVMVHANGELPVRQALEAGCHSIEHGFFMGRDNLARMAEKQIIWVPTAYAMKICAEKSGKVDIAVKKEVAEKTLRHQLEQIALAKAAGVTIALGTDAGSRGVLHGESVVEEIKLLIQGGYSLTEAIQCASYNGAKLLGIENEMGLIAKGKPANFLVVRGTPAQLPQKVSHLEAIYLYGSPCRKSSRIS